MEEVKKGGRNSKIYIRNSANDKDTTHIRYCISLKDGQSMSSKWRITWSKLWILAVAIRISCSKMKHVEWLQYILTSISNDALIVYRINNWHKCNN